MLFNPYPAVYDNPYLCKQCKSRSEASEETWMKKLYDVIWLADRQKWVWLIKLFSRIKVNILLDLKGILLDLKGINQGTKERPQSQSITFLWP